MVVMASLRALRNSGLALRLIRRCQYIMTGRVLDLVLGVPHKPQDDPKSDLMSLHGGLLPKIEAP